MTFFPRYTTLTIFFITSCCIINVSVGCMCKLSSNDVPTCGSDGKIYHSLCLLNCERFYNKSIYSKKMQFCWSRQHSKSKCVCEDEYEPVCGSDGRTYYNECILTCKSRRRPSLKIEKQGKCPKGSRKNLRKNISDKFDYTISTQNNSIL